MVAPLLGLLHILPDHFARQRIPLQLFEVPLGSLSFEAAPCGGTVFR
jgi:hypothetical protein